MKHLETAAAGMEVISVVYSLRVFSSGIIEKKSDNEIKGEYFSAITSERIFSYQSYSSYGNNRGYRRGR
jgi:hypothetical protein